MAQAKLRNYFGPKQKRPSNALLDLSASSQNDDTVLRKKKKKKNHTIDIEFGADLLKVYPRENLSE